MNLLYFQTNNLSANANLGAMNVACSPSSPNAFTGVVDTGNREGTNSFYVQPGGYVTVGDIGYVHRGEPWATIRLQPYPAHPYGDGILLDNFRVTDLTDVAGRINVNSDTNGPLGWSQSPALFALFSGITNPAYASPGNAIDGSSDDKIKAIINELGNYRKGLADGTMVYIGQMCAISNLTTDLSFSPIAYTDDANREAVIRAISNLITTWQSGGTAEIIGWGQVVKGGDTGITNGTPGLIVGIQARFKNENKRLKLTSFQYITQ